MTLSELFNTLILILILLASIALYNYILKRLVSTLFRKFALALGVFLLLSATLLASPYLEKQAYDPSTPYNIRMLIQCLWWFSLNFMANRFVDYFIWNKFFFQKGISVSKIFRDLISFLFLIVTVAAIVHFVFARPVWGIFTASGVMAIILGYSAQATLSDVFAGLGLNSAKQFNSGDWVKLVGIGVNDTGRVSEINWRFVTLETLEGNTLTIPNSIVSKMAVTNFSYPTQMRGVKITLPIKGVISPEKIKHIIVSSAQQSKRVLKTPSPNATLIELRLTEYLYQLLYYTNEVNESIVNDEILSIIWYQMKRAQLLDDPNKISESVDEKIGESFKSFIHKMDLFAILTPDEIRILTANCHVVHYGPPERLLLQGQSNTSLFIIYKGSVDVYIKTESTDSVRVASLVAGQYFGEMSLLTGEPCTATIVVNTESTIIEVDHDNMAALFAIRPELVEKMSEIIIIRKQQNDDARSSHLNKKNKQHETLIDRLASRVRGFFNLIKAT